MTSTPEADALLNRDRLSVNKWSIHEILQVGLLIALSGGADALSSLVSTKISSRFGINVTMAIGFCHDIGFYIFCSFWIPTESTTWLVYIVFVCAGTSDGIWQPLVNGKFHQSKGQKIKSSLYSRYYAETCNEWRAHLRGLAPAQHSSCRKYRSGGKLLASLSRFTCTI